MRPHCGITVPLAVLGAALVVVLASAGCSQLSSSNPFPANPFSGVIEPGIVPALGQTGSKVVERDFAFEGGNVRIKVPVDQAVYQGSASAQKNAIFLGSKSTGGWVADYYRAFIDERHQADFYASLATALHAVRDEKKLDSDRYVELVTSMAQSIEYRVDPGNLAPKFPIETFGDGYGDCDDKALLAASILSRDGYDVAILVFGPEEHVALGIRAEGLDYKHTGYAYVEMTRPSLVGVPAEKLAGNIRLTSQPVVIRIGNGTRSYTAGAQIEYIQQKLLEVRADETRLRGEIATRKADLDSRNAALKTARQALQNSSSNSPSFAAAVQTYNEQVREYDALVAQSNGVIGHYNSLLEGERFAVAHQTARPDVYQHLHDLGL